MWAGPSVVKRAYSDMGTKKPPTAWQWAAFGGCFGRGERIPDQVDLRIFSLCELMINCHCNIPL